MISKYMWIGMAVGLFFAGLGVSYAIFAYTYNPYSMMGNPNMFNQMMSQNPQYMGTWMGSMMQDPQLRQQMYNYMSQNQNFMYGMMQNPQLMNQWMSSMMQNPQFRQQYMGPWMMMQNPKYMGPMMNQWYGSNTLQGQYTGSPIKTDQVSIAKESWEYNSTLAYQPPVIQVSQGTTITWTNNDYVVHTVTDVGGKFDSQLIQPQSTWKYTFDTKGTYNYFCTLHPWMKGTVIVQ